jgi:hypothetical protein
MVAKTSNVANGAAKDVAGKSQTTENAQQETSSSSASPKTESGSHSTTTSQSSSDDDKIETKKSNPGPSLAPMDKAEAGTMDDNTRQNDSHNNTINPHDITSATDITTDTANVDEAMDSINKRENEAKNATATHGDYSMATGQDSEVAKMAPTITTMMEAGQISNQETLDQFNDDDVDDDDDDDDDDNSSVVIGEALPISTTPLQNMIPEYQAYILPWLVHKNYPSELSLSTPIDDEVAVIPPPNPASSAKYNPGMRTVNKIVNTSLQHAPIETSLTPSFHSGNKRNAMVPLARIKKKTHLHDTVTGQFDDAPEANVKPATATTTATPVSISPKPQSQQPQPPPQQSPQQRQLPPLPPQPHYGYAYYHNHAMPVMGPVPMPPSHSNPYPFTMPHNYHHFHTSGRPMAVQAVYNAMCAAQQKHMQMEQSPQRPQQKTQESRPSRTEQDTNSTLQQAESDLVKAHGKVEASKEEGSNVDANATAGAGNPRPLAGP